MRVCFRKEVFFKMLPDIYGKKRAPESLLKLSLQLLYYNKTPAHAFSCEFLEIIKENFFIKHLRATASECRRVKKSSWLLVEDIIFQLLEVFILNDSILTDLIMGCRNFIFKLFPKKRRKSLEFSEIFAMLSMVWFSCFLLLM